MMGRHGFYIVLLILICACGSPPTENQIIVPNKVYQGAKKLSLNSLAVIKDEDSLEMEAVKFVIENAMFHAHENDSRVKSYVDVIEKFYQEDELLINKIACIKNVNTDRKSDYDIYSIDDSSFVNDIRTTYNLYRKYYRNKISFNVFCNYSLPYKVHDEEPSFKWRTYYRNLFLEEHDTMLFHKSIDKLAEEVHQWMYKRKKTFRLFWGGKSLMIPDLPSDVIDKLNIGSCHELTAVGVSAMRALGIPCAVDFVPNYLNINGGHEWSSVVLDSMHCIPFDITASSMNKVKKDVNLFAKVYRRTFKPVKNSHVFWRGYCPFLPDFFNSPFILDVTSSYIKTSNVEVSTSHVLNDNIKYAYLCIFDRQKLSWVPVAWGVIKKNVAHFENVGRKGVYLPALIDEKGMCPINAPFAIDSVGHLKYIKPNVHKIQSVKLCRKFRDDIFKKEQMNRMIGGVFQGANKADFSDAVNLYRIKTNPGEYFNLIDMHTRRCFRYLRYYSPKNSFGNIAEVEFWEKGQKEKFLQGTVIGTDGSYLDDPKCTKSAAFDGNVLTYFDSKIADNSWVGLDLGDKRCIGHIRFIARNDMNGIQKGDLYELFYWDNEWKSLGKIIADTIVLNYNNVPQNSVLWLRDYTEGSEERIFTYENGKQVWW